MTDTPAKRGPGRPPGSKVPKQEVTQPGPEQESPREDSEIEAIRKEYKEEIGVLKDQVSKLLEALSNQRKSDRSSDDENPVSLEKPEENMPYHLRKVRAEFRRKERQVLTPDKVDEFQEYNPRRMASTGPADESLDPLTVDSDIYIVDDRKWTKSKLEHEEFMHEMILVKVAESTNPTDSPIVEVSNGGQIHIFIRGREEWVRRKFIEPLLRAKETKYTQETTTIRGIRDIVNHPTTQPMYQVTILKDENPKGAAWYNHLLRAPN